MDKKVRFLIICLLVFCALAIIGYKIYNSYLYTSNTKKFYSCVDKYDISLDSKTREKGIIVYNTSIDKYLFEKYISEKDNDSHKTIIMYYNIKDNCIDSALTMRNENGLYSINGKINIENNQFSCDTILVNNKFDDKCHELKKQSEKFLNEVNKISKKCDFNIKYVKLK